MIKISVNFPWILWETFWVTQALGVIMTQWKARPGPFGAIHLVNGALAPGMASCRRTGNITLNFTLDLTLHGLQLGNHVSLKYLAGRVPLKLSNWFQIDMIIPVNFVFSFRNWCSKFYFQLNTTLKQKQFVNINIYIVTLLHSAGGHQGSCKAHQAGNQNLGDIIRALIFLQSIMTQMFIQQLVQGNIIDKIKVLHQWPF